MNDDWFSTVFIGDDNPKGQGHSLSMALRGLWELPGALWSTVAVPLFIVLVTHLLIIPIAGLRGKISYLSDLDALEEMDEVEDEC